MTQPERLWHVAFCLECEPMLPMPFDDEAERAAWCAKHVEATNHAVVSVDNVRLSDQVIRDIAAG